MAVLLAKKLVRTRVEDGLGLNVQRLTVLIVFAILRLPGDVAVPKCLEALLLWLACRHPLSVWVLAKQIIGRCCYHEVYLGALVRDQVRWLLVKVLPDLLVLHFVEHSLQQLFELVLAHDGLRHADERHLGRLPDVLAGVEQVVGEVHQQLVTLLEE